MGRSTHSCLFNGHGQYWLVSRHGNVHVDELSAACFQPLAGHVDGPTFLSDHLALKTVPCAGYGRQDPQTVLDCWLTALSLLWGMCIWTFLGSIVTTLLIHLNAASSEYTAKITALNQYMAHRKLPQVQHLSPDNSSCNAVTWPGPHHHVCETV